MNYVWIVLGLLVVGGSSLAIWHAWHDPQFYVKIIKGLVFEFLPGLLDGFLKMAKPASPEELARRKKVRDQGGEDAPSARPFDRDKE